MFRIIIFSLVALFSLFVLFKNRIQWSKSLQEYMRRESIKTFGNESGWGQSWASLISNLLVVFLGLMAILFFYIVIFSI